MLRNFHMQDASSGDKTIRRLDWADPGQGQVADACECGNEPSGSVKMWGIS